VASSIDSLLRLSLFRGGGDEELVVFEPSRSPCAMLISPREGQRLIKFGCSDELIPFSEEADIRPWCFGPMAMVTQILRIRRADVGRGDDCLYLLQPSLGNPS